MKKRMLILLSGSLAFGAVIAPAGLAAPTAPSTHGCALQDINGTGTPVVHQSDTSTIGGNSCTFTAMTNLTDNSGPSYAATAATWSISGCTPGTDATGQPICTANPADSYSSAAGSKPAGAPGSLTPGDVITVKVTDGSIVAGTLSSS